MHWQPEKSKSFQGSKTLDDEKQNTKYVIFESPGSGYDSSEGHHRPSETVELSFKYHTVQLVFGQLSQHSRLLPSPYWS